jgi:hypothetical protein
MYSLLFMLFGKSSMSSILEYLIRNIPEEDLNRIRNEEKL